MSLKNEKKAYRIKIDVFVYCTYFQTSRYQERIIKFIEKIISKKKLVRVNCSFTNGFSI